ncbi:MAG TPA: ABC transporter substrate-binding protein [Xanthobacteraceae bacterium]|jgi:branched-chain amino acid transport system substrate-binding protein|nr:ABC transporter substrate-binding protein [Xanthobacteraceae bacterium]
MTITSRRMVPLLLGGCVALGLSASAPARADDLRIGFLAPTTGFLSQTGQDMEHGFELYLNDHGGKLGGVKVDLIVEDTQGKPDVAVTKAKKLVLQDHVSMFVGGVLASTGYALAPVSTEEKTLYISSVAAADDLTQRQLSKYPYFIRTAWTSSLPNHPLGQWACEQGYKKVVTIAADYAFGYESVGGFQKAFEDCGGKVIQKIWPPLGNKDFGPFIPTIKSDADAIYSLMVGPMAPQFPKQLRDAGVKLPIIAGGTSYDDYNLAFDGDEVIGDVSSLMYSAALQTPKNEAFVKEFRAKYNEVPGYYAEANYTTAQMIDEAMAKNGGKFPGAEKFIQTMLGLKIEAARGPVAFDDMRNPVENVYIRKVEKVALFGDAKPQLWNVVIKTYPNVGQFWTYGKDEFLKQPVYSRDFPPCKYCE